jgi:hypothetical protein
MSKQEVLPPKPTKSEVNRRDRIGLRAMCQETVHHFTLLRRRELAEQIEQERGYPPTEQELDALQPLSEEFDPVVELAIIAVDRRNEVTVRRQALSDAAQYLRPKLSAVAHLEDPSTLVQESKNQELAMRLVQAMEVVARSKTE